MYNIQRIERNTKLFRKFQYIFFVGELDKQHPKKGKKKEKK